MTQNNNIDLDIAIRRKIMVVDEDPSVREHMRTLLESAGYEVTIVDSVRGLAFKIFDAKPDLILLDVDTGALQGDSVLNLIDGQKQLVTARVVLLSGGPAHQLSTLAQKVQAGGWIEKTLDDDEFLIQIGQLFDSA